MGVEVSSEWEKRYKRPEYHRPIVELMETFLRQDQNVGTVREFSGGLLPTEVDWNRAYGMENSWAGTDKILREFDKHKHPSGITNQDILIQEYKLWNEHGRDNGLVEFLPNMVSALGDAYTNLSLTDISVPTIVARWYIETIFPMLTNLEMYNVHTVGGTKVEFKIENWTQVQSTRITIPLSITLADDEEVDLGQRHLDLKKTYSMGSVILDNFVINPTNGILKNVSGANLVLDDLIIYQFPYEFGESSAPPESKVTNTTKIVNTKWDGVSVRISHRSQIGSMSSSGYPLTVRAMAAAAFEIREMVDRSLANHAEYALQYSIPSNKITTYTRKFGNGAMPDDVYYMVGSTITSMRENGFFPSRVYSSHEVLRMFSELYETKADSSINVEDRTEVLAIVPRIKGIPPRGIRYWNDNFIVIAKPPIADYAVLASQPFTISKEIRGTSSDGNAIAVSDFLCQINHWIDGPFKTENIAVIKES